MPTARAVRNVAVIAHVDHGKTSLVGAVLEAVAAAGGGSDAGGSGGGGVAAYLDSNPLERERGITILSKVTSCAHGGAVFNIVDTPGHADFGGEVERVLGMVDGVLLVVCAVEGPMPQTRYTLSKALAAGLPAVVVINKADREGARLGVVENEVFDLFAALDASDEQMDFPIVYASAREGWVSTTPDGPRQPMTALLGALAGRVPPPAVLGDEDAPFRMLVSQMDFSDFIGKLLIGRVASGTVRPGDSLVALSRDGAKLEEGKVTKLFARRGNTPVAVPVAYPGDIVQVAGLSVPTPTATVGAPGTVRPLYAAALDPPTLAMAFGVNDSPLAGREGSRLTSSMIAERLAKEAATNVALGVHAAEVVEGMPDAVEVRGRGELQLAVLIENMRREGFELSISPPVVLLRTDPATGEKLEPYENVVIDVDEAFSGAVIEKLAARKAVMKDFGATGGKNEGKARITFYAPSRGLLGLTSELKTDSRGTATMHRVFDAYGPYLRGLDRKPRAVMVSNAAGPITAYALDGLQARGTLFVTPGSPTYVGHVIGECSRDSLYDMNVNPVRAKKLTNVRATGHDDAIRLSPPRAFSLEEAIVWVAPDELVEVTPSLVRLRKRILDESERDKASRTMAKAMRDK